MLAWVSDTPYRDCAHILVQHVSLLRNVYDQLSLAICSFPVLDRLIMYTLFHPENSHGNLITSAIQASQVNILCGHNRQWKCVLPTSNCNAV
jgi:hypothetical protein